MAELTDKQKRYAVYGAAGLVLLYLLYRWYSGNQASNQASTGAGVTAPNTGSSDYAALAGQEQGDVASLQSALNSLYGTEQSDVTGLNTGLAGLGQQVTGLGGQEQADVSGLTSSIGGLTGQLQNLADLQSSLGNQVAGIAMGVQPVSPASVSTHKGGAFYNYYVKVTGHPPPASVQTSNFIYEAWKGGVKATALQASSTPHPSSRNTQIAHPNGNHAPRTQVAHPNTPKAAPAKPKPPAKPAAKVPPKPAPKPKPPPKTKPKASGPRK